MTNRILLIYNPRAGKGLFLTKLPEVIDMFTKAGFAVEVYPTQSHGDAVTRLKNLGDDYNMVVAAGGDGTLEEIATGMIKSGRDIPIGYIPVGSTNDYASSFGISSNIIEAVGDIISGQPVGIDVGVFNKESIFIYVAAFGAFTEVSYETDQSMKNVLGHAAYVLEATRRLGDLQPYRMKVKVNDTLIEQEYIYGMITNATQVGGIKGITGKGVSLDDGLFEVTLVHNPRNVIELQEIIGCLLSANDTTDYIDTFKVSSLDIESKEGVAWTLDGERGGSHKRVHIENRQQRIKLIAEKQAVNSGVLVNAPNIS